MADYWKSQPRKFCQYCKCWIADNKPSVEFHERGKKHKENVTAKISEIKKKSVDKMKQEEKSSKEFAAMEEAALKAYEEDLKRMEREAAGLDSPAPTIAQAKPRPRPVVINQVKNPSKKQLKQQKQQKANKKPPNPPPQAQVWVEGQMYDGRKYYYNTITGESQWEKPGGFPGNASASHPPQRTESSSGCPWTEAVSPDGYAYYYNSETGESTWEKPAGFPSSEASGPNQAGESPGEPSATQAGETSNGAAASEKAEVPEDASEPSNVPKISFRKRKADGEPPEEEGEDAAGETAPEEGAGEAKREEEVQSKAAEPEGEKRGDATQKKTQARRSKGPNPYGAWEQIKKAVDPYASVDLQLPRFEGCPAAGAPADPPPEPKPKFRERVITSLGEGEEEGGPASFRKSKTQNGKTRRLRQRDDDEED